MLGHVNLIDQRMEKCQARCELETILSNGEAANDELCDWLVLAFFSVLERM